MKRYIFSSDNEIVDIKTLYKEISDIAKKNDCQITNETGYFNQDGSIATIYPRINLLVDNVHVWISKNNTIISRINFSNAHSITEESNIASDLNSSIDTLTTIYDIVSEIQKIHINK